MTGAFLCLACLAWLWVALTLARVARRVGFLPAGGPPGEAGLPSLSLLIAARDEARTLEAALQALLKLDYPQLEIWVVNDRSQDATGDLLEHQAGRDSRLRVLHINELPPGWLGKNHALQCAARQAQGEWLLFSDADVLFEPDSLARALRLAQQAECDHLVLGPRILCETFWEKVFVAFFGTAFCYRYRPDLVGQKGPYYAGVGAFNLIRRRVYEELGGHTSLAMEVLDDMELGKLVKSRGFRQRFVAAPDAVSVRWAEGLGGLIRGLEKNAFAGLHYSVGFALVSCAITLWASWAPLGLLWLGWTGWGALGLLAMLACSTINCRGVGHPFWCGLFFPLAGTVFCYVLLRAAWLCQWRGGIHWRGTFYTLRDLRQSP